MPRSVCRMSKVRMLRDPLRPVKACLKRRTALAAVQRFEIEASDNLIGGVIMGATLQLLEYIDL